MKPVEQFLREFLEERERKALDIYAELLGLGPAEDIESVTNFAGSAVATTRINLGGKAYMRNRYRLRSDGDTWAIYQISYQMRTVPGHWQKTGDWRRLRQVSWCGLGSSGRSYNIMSFCANHAAAVDAPTGVSLQWLRPGRRATAQRR